MYGKKNIANFRSFYENLKKDNQVHGASFFYFNYDYNPIIVKLLLDRYRDLLLKEGYTIYENRIHLDGWIKKYVYRRDQPTKMKKKDFDEFNRILQRYRHIVHLLDECGDDDDEFHELGIEEEFYNEEEIEYLKSLVLKINKAIDSVK